MPAHFAREKVYVATSQFKRSEHDRCQAQCAETLRARRASEEARSMEGRQQSHRPAENQAGRLIGSVRGDS